MLVLSVAVFVTVTVATAAPAPEQVRQVAWARQAWRDESADLRGTPWWRSYRPYAIGRFVVTLLALVPFL